MSETRKVFHRQGGLFDVMPIERHMTLMDVMHALAGLGSCRCRAVDGSASAPNISRRLGIDSRLIDQDAIFSVVADGGSPKCLTGMTMYIW